MGLQYTGIEYETGAYDFRQPGLVVSLRGASTAIPLRVDLYGTFRSQSRGSVALFSSTSTSDARIYRLAVEYDDGSTILSAGRLLPSFAASVGIIDGISVARRWSSVTAGASLGFQPGATLGAPSFDQRKVILFGQYEARDTWNTSTGAAVSTVFSNDGIERQTISATASTYSPSGFSLYASTDLDVRAPSSAGNDIDPRLSLFICSMNYRVTTAIGVGVGIDASRPTYTLSFAQSLPDSLLDRRLRAGASFSVNISLSSGIGLTNTYTPRSSEGRFGEEYSSSTGAYASDVLSSGVSTRVNFSLNQNAQSEVKSGSVSLQRTVFGTDVGFRYQRSHFVLRQVDLSSTTESFGMDLNGSFSRALTWMASVDLSTGLNDRATTVFLELSWRL